MKKLLLILSIAVCTTSFAQFTFGPKAGWSDFKTQLSDSSDNQYKGGLHIGGFADYQFGSHFSIVGEMCFSQRASQTDAASLTMNYLDVPIMCQLLIDMQRTGRGKNDVWINDNKAILTLAQFGIEPSFLLSSNYTIKKTGTSSADNSSFASTIISIPLGIVYQVHSILIGLRGHLSFSNLLTSDATKNPTNRLQTWFGFQISLGYRFSAGGNKGGRRH